MLAALPYKGGDIIVKDYNRVLLEVIVKGGIKSGAADLLAKKMATLVMVLEESLLLKLVAPSRGRRIMEPVSKESNVVRGGWPKDGDNWMVPIAVRKRPNVVKGEWLQGGAVNADYDSHVHPLLTWFCFEHLQSTFDYRLLRNWVEVIAHIVELALAGPDEYKRCLEDIFRIQHDADQGGVAWEQLMAHALKLEHRIQGWRDQLARYDQPTECEQEEIMTGAEELLLLDRRHERKQRYPYHRRAQAERQAKPDAWGNFEK
ncbi:hypothetical protein LCI18_002478 [Fusarium solani-melongenae]|uniref:Uncharacterized protein n=1 Tax=Fusarium solani subsp. cucurbitae TaxID=2747967 RepID=A0ACD3YRR3_FUSSC|nr:hypothetical protein LCI18_002478 [Fusarium solani-melongenae]